MSSVWINERQMSGKSLCLGFFVCLTDTRRNLLSVLDEEHMARPSLKMVNGDGGGGGLIHLQFVSFQGVLASRASSRVL